MKTTSKPVALTIAGSDSGGGAGIQADLRTFSAFDVHGVCAITAITAQNTVTVSAVEMVSTRMIEAQLVALFDDFAIGAIKTGMLGSPAVVRRVRACLDRHPRIPVIVDPVLVATSGAQLAEAGLVPALHRHLLTRADLLTPNVPEAM
ncbi:MAG: hydroxymethylpyrimidine/phosphomethylpyrimidine kinase, partial [Dokdonella sp.]